MPSADLYVLQLCFLQPPTAADDDNDFLDFSHDDVYIFFHHHFRSLMYNDDDRVLHYLQNRGFHYDVTAAVIQPIYLLTGFSCYATSFSPSSNHRP